MWVLLLAAACTQRVDCAVTGLASGCETLLPTEAGRVDWCHAEDLIAVDRYDARSPEVDAEVWTMKPDGSDATCISCLATELPGGIRGQPAWHPSCGFLVVQVESEDNEGTLYETVAWGIHNALWLLAADGSWAEPLLDVQALEGALHPQFSSDGGHLFWASRSSTGVTVPQLPGNPTPGRENPWEGWFLSHATFSRGAEGPGELGDRVDLFQDQGGFYESHAMGDDRLWFSHTADGAYYVDDCFTAALDGSDLQNLTNSPSTWDEHCHPSPQGALAFNSSRSQDWDAGDGDLATSLRLELWVQEEGGQPQQLTRYNEEAGRRPRVVTSDFAWGPKGELLAYRVEIRGRDWSQALDRIELE